jgi:hypothetical protein
MIISLRATLALLAFVLPVSAFAQACTWFGSKDHLAQVAVGASTPAVTIPIGDATSIAMNAQDCGVWALGKTQLRRYTAQGELAQTFALTSIDKRLELATRIAVDAYDGSVWIAGDRVLAHVSATGVPMAVPAFDGNVRSIAVALDQRSSAPSAPPCRRSTFALRGRAK